MDLTWIHFLLQKYKERALYSVDWGKPGNCKNAAIIFLSCAFTIQFIALPLTAAFQSARTAVKHISWSQNSRFEYLCIYGLPPRGTSGVTSIVLICYALSPWAWGL